MADQLADRAAIRLGAIARFSPAVLLIMAAFFGLVGQWLFYGVGLGMNLGLAVIALLAGAYFVRPIDRRIDRLDVWIAPAALVFAFLPALRTDPMLLLFDVPAALTLAGMAALSFAGVPLTRRAPDVLVVLGLVATGRMFTGGGVVLGALPEVGRPLARRAGGGLVSAGIGLAMAIPFLLIFGLLFASADAVFSSAMRNLFDLEKWSFGETVGRIALALFFAYTAGGILLLAGRGAETKFPPLMPRVRGLVSSTAAITMLFAVDGLFLFFVGLQVAYLFGGLDTLHATGLTYSAYARRGFFELIYAATLAGALLFGTELVVARRTRLYLVTTLVLAVATGIVVISAAYRMQLYQVAYGWTELRFYALAGIAWLGIGVLVTIALLVRDATRWLLHAAALAGLAVGLAINLLGPSAFVARQNLERVIQPADLPPDAYRGVDVSYLVSLGDGAVPTLLEVLPRLDAPSRELLGSHLRTYSLRRTEGSPPDPWQSLNVDRARARAALLAAADDLRVYPAFR